MATVFLSSTFAEMEDFRNQAFLAIDQFGHRSIRMETFPAADREIASFCRARVAECDAFVLVLGKFYGSPIPGRRISYTEDEFDAAVELGKPILVFLPSPKVKTNTDAALARMEVNGLTYEEQKGLQAEFNKKALRNRLPRTFDDLSDLKFQVGHSLNELLQGAVQTDQKRYAGEMLPLSCDRGPQLARFGECYQTGRPGQPQLFVLYGHESEQHKNCVRRLLCFHLKYPHKKSSGTLLLPADDSSDALVEWPRDDTQEILFNRLRRGLFQAIDPGYSFPDGYSVPSFCKLLVSTKATHIWFKHSLRPSAWTQAAQSLCTSAYFGFWQDVGKFFDGLPAAEPRPRILVFFEFKHRLNEGDERAAFRASIDETFAARRPSGLSCEILQELPSVGESDLDVWYERYERYVLPRYRGKQVGELFSEFPLPMTSVEKRLHELLGMEAYSG